MKNKYPFDLLFLDLWNSPIFGCNGERYFLAIVDDFDCFIWLFCMEKKDQTISLFLYFLQMIRTQFNVSVKNIQTYSGGEFIVNGQLSCP